MSRLPAEVGGAGQGTSHGSSSSVCSSSGRRSALHRRRHALFSLAMAAPPPPLRWVYTATTTVASAPTSLLPRWMREAWRGQGGGWRYKEVEEEDDGPPKLSRRPTFSPSSHHRDTYNGPNITEFCYTSTYNEAMRWRRPKGSTKHALRMWFLPLQWGVGSGMTAVRYTNNLKESVSFEYFCATPLLLSFFSFHILCSFVNVLVLHPKVSCMRLCLVFRFLDLVVFSFVSVSRAFIPCSSCMFRGRMPSLVTSHKSDLALKDLTGTGCCFPYTFKNNIRGRSNVKIWLNRAVATPDWHYIFKESRVQHLVSPFVTTVQFLYA